MLSALHSLRIAGFVQVGGLPVQDTETADQKTARATGKSLRMNMTRSVGAQMLVKTPSQFMALEIIEFTTGAMRWDHQAERYVQGRQSNIGGVR